MYKKVNFEGNLAKVRRNVGKCVIEAVKTWNMMPDGVIYNCFKQTSILPATWHDLDVNEPVVAMSLLREAQVVIQYCTDNVSRALLEPVSAEEFVNGMDGENITENPLDRGDVL